MLNLRFVFNRESHFMDGLKGYVRPMYFREFEKSAKRKAAWIVRAVEKETGLSGEELADELNRRYQVVRESGWFGIKPR
jgi:hypothetical protein